MPRPRYVNLDHVTFVVSITGQLLCDRPSAIRQGILKGDGRNERANRIDGLFWGNSISRLEKFARVQSKRTNLGTQMGSRRVKRARGAREPLGLLQSAREDPG